VIVVAAFEPPAIVAGLDDVAVVGQAVEQRGRHLGVAEHGRPFAECEIGGYDDGGALIEPADEVEEKLATGLGEGQIAEFIQHDEVHPGQMRVGGLGGMILARLGVVPQQIATGETYAALERGTIDAVEVTGPFDDERFGFQKVAPYYYYPSFNEGNVELSFFISLNKWNSLPKPYQAAVRAACSFAADEALSGYDGEQTEPLRRLVANGTQLKQVPNDIVEAARAAALALYDELSAKSEDFKKVYSHYRDFTASAYQWWQVAEYSYDTMMLKSLRR
jgi:Bacterial extracellular solute-binding protein, family 7